MRLAENKGKLCWLLPQRVRRIKKKSKEKRNKNHCCSRGKTRCSLNEKLVYSFQDFILKKEQKKINTLGKKKQNTQKTRNKTNTQKTQIKPKPSIKPQQNQRNPQKKQNNS